MTTKIFEDIKDICENYLGDSILTDADPDIFIIKIKNKISEYDRRTHMKYFIMGWDDDSDDKRYKDFYFVGDEEGNLVLFDSEQEAETIGRQTCRYCTICSWHNYIAGDEKIKFARLILVPQV